MKFIPLFALSALILTGCGGSGGGSDSSDSTGAVSSNDSNASTGTEVTTPPTNGNSGTGGDNSGTTDPVSPPASDEFADLMLYAVNQARSQEQNCGGTIMPAVPALTWDYSLESAAFTHSSDMANADFMDHTGSDGSDPGDRVADTGYVANAWAENVAAGQRDIDTVMASWMASSGHCKNIMSSSVTQMGASAVENPDTRYGIYWTQVFARPQ